MADLKAFQDDSMELSLRDLQKVSGKNFQNFELMSAKRLTVWQWGTIEWWHLAVILKCKMDTIRSLSDFIHFCQLWHVFHICISWNALRQFWSTKHCCALGDILWIICAVANWPWTCFDPASHGVSRMWWNYIALPPCDVVRNDIGIHQWM